MTRSQSRTLTLVAALVVASAARAAPPFVPGPCIGKRVVLVPLDPVAVSPEVARRQEERIRQALGALPGRCVEPRAQTVARLRDQPAPLQACGDRACRAAQALLLEADWLVSGSVLGVGGTFTAALMAWDRTGEPVRHASLSLEEGRALEVASLQPFFGAEAKSKAFDHRPVVYVLAGAGLVAAIAGAGLGIASSATARAVSEGQTGCPGVGEQYQRCFSERVGTGRLQATAANALFGAAGLLGVSATVMLVVELP